MPPGAPRPGPGAGGTLSAVLRTGPFHEALHAAVTARGLSLHRLRDRLARRGIRIGVTSLSYWQSGARRPERPESLRAVQALEEVLELPPHALTRLLGPRLAPERAAGQDVRRAGRPYRQLLEPAAALERLFTELELPLDGGLHTVGHHERVRLDGRRRVAERESQHVLRAHREGVDRYVAIYQGDAGCDVERVRVRARENCRLGRVRRYRPAALVVAELLFDERLRTGESHLLGYGFADGTGEESHEFVRGFPFPAGQYVLQVRFDPAALPVRCRRFARRAAGAAPRDVAELSLGPYHAAHVVVEQVPPGIVGIGWDWD